MDGSTGTGMGSGTARTRGTADNQTVGNRSVGRGKRQSKTQEAFISKVK